MLQKFHCEHVLEELGNFGTYQKLLITTVIIPFSILASFQSMTLHNELVPDHWCYVDVLANFSYGEQHRLIRPKVLNRFDSRNPSLPSDKTLSQCEMFDIDYREVVSGLEVLIKANESSSTAKPIPTKRCTDGWIYNQLQYRDNAAMHYNFVCGQQNGMRTVHLTRSLSSALFGPFYAILVDRYGRRTGLMLILFAYILSSVAPIFTTNYQIFLACQAINASTFPISILTVLIYGIEFTIPQYRSYVVAFAGLSFHLGQWINILLTIICSHWVWIAAINTILTFPCFFILYYTDESPQWLLATNQPTQLKHFFDKLNKTNRAKLDDESLNSIISKFTHFGDFQLKQKQQKRGNTNSNKINLNQTQVKSFDTTNQDSEQHRDEATHSIDSKDSNGNCFGRMKLILKRSSLFQLMFLFAFILVSNKLNSDFLSKQKNKFNTNPVLDNFFVFLIKLPAIILTWYLIEQRIGRRWSNCCIQLLSLLLLIIQLVGHRWWWSTSRFVWLNVAHSLLGILLAECSTIITVLQLIELSPVRYRAIVASLTYSFSTIATLSIQQVFNSQSLRLLFNVYTMLALLSLLTLISIIVASFVTETRNEFLPLGVLSSEQLITNVSYWSMSKKKSDIAPSNLFLSLSKWDINSNHQIVGSIKHLEKFTDS